jgi:hypothetical protein
MSLTKFCSGLRGIWPIVDLGFRNPMMLSYLPAYSSSAAPASTLSERLGTAAAVAGLGRCCTARLRLRAVEGAKFDLWSSNSLYLDALLER